ncbi:MAG TPA: hypothetical protein VL043_03875 [Protaetiibacter sp.]|nr:hypothetical protein [Protaetiibacter sp.]
MVPLSETDEKKWVMALDAAQGVLAKGPAPSAPDYEGKQSIRQVQRRLTPDETRAVANEYLAGSSMHEISARWVINRETVAAALKRAGVGTRQPKTLTNDELQEAAALFESGWSLNQLGKKFGIDPKTMKKRLCSAMPGQRDED